MNSVCYQDLIALVFVLLTFVNQSSAFALSSKFAFQLDQVKHTLARNYSHNKPK